MKINYCVYNTNKKIIFENLESYEQSVELAQLNDDWAASNSSAGLAYVTSDEFFDF